MDHVKVAEGLGCKALRVFDPEGDPAGAGDRREARRPEHRVPVLVEVILERVTDIAMGPEIDNIVEFEGLAANDEDAPTFVMHLD